MATYEIIQTVSGVHMGFYEADSAGEAIRTMLDDAGTDEAPDAGLEAREVESAAELALKGLGLQSVAGVVLVDDGDSEWLCGEAAWEAAVEQLRRMSAPAGNVDDAGMEAYGMLCNAIRGPIASPHQATTDEARALARRALDAGLIDEDSYLGKLAVGVEAAGLLMDYDTGKTIRPATPAEAKASREEAERGTGAGVIMVDGRRCYVEE